MGIPFLQTTLYKTQANRKLTGLYIYAPYVIKTVKTTVNNVTVWHSNKLINLLLKIKFFFWKPKTLKRFEKYINKPINPKFYKTITINEDE